MEALQALAQLALSHPDAVLLRWWVPLGAAAETCSGDADPSVRMHGIKVRVYMLPASACVSDARSCWRSLAAVYTPRTRSARCAAIRLLPGLLYPPMLISWDYNTHRRG